MLAQVFTLERWIKHFYDNIDQLVEQVLVVVTGYMVDNSQYRVSFSDQYIIKRSRDWSLQEKVTKQVIILIQTEIL